MPTDSRSFEHARQLLSKYWAEPGTAACIEHLLPDMVKLLESSHAPARDLRGTIRQMLAEHQAACESTAKTALAVLDEQTDALVRLLDEVRDHAITEGRWTDAPVTPLMCG